jgi:hypothetical protein
VNVGFLSEAYLPFAKFKDTLIDSNNSIDSLEIVSFEILTWIIYQHFLYYLVKFLNSIPLFL